MFYPLEIGSEQAKVDWKTGPNRSIQYKPSWTNRFSSDRKTIFRHNYKKPEENRIFSEKLWITVKLFMNLLSYANYMYHKHRVRPSLARTSINLYYKFIHYIIATRYIITIVFYNHKSIWTVDRKRLGAKDGRIVSSRALYTTNVFCT